MSSWKKAAKVGQKKYKERHQPASREHLGLLEKKKDYKIRANDHNAKEKTLKYLRRRALNRNPDEFYFHMINSGLKDGRHHEIEKDDDHTPQQIKLMETQDLRYINMKRTMEMKKIETSQAQLHILDTANQTPNTHVFFVDSKKEAKNFDIVKQLDTHPELIANRINRLKMTDLQNKSFDFVDKTNVRELRAKRKKNYLELAKRIDRERELSVTLNKLEVKGHLSKSQAAGVYPTKVKPATKNSAAIYKWNYERKR